MDESAPQHVMQNLLGYAAIKGGRYSYYTSKALGYTALEDVAESAARILMEGPTKHSGKDYWFFSGRTHCEAGG